MQFDNEFTTNLLLLAVVYNVTILEIKHALERVQELKHALESVR